MIKMATTLEDTQTINRIAEINYNKNFDELTIEFAQGLNIRDVLYLLLVSSKKTKTSD